MSTPTLQTKPGQTGHRGRLPAQQLGRWLKRQRLAHDRQLQEVAATAGMKASQLSKIEAGEHDPQWSTVVRVVKALDPTANPNPATLLHQVESDMAY